MNSATKYTGVTALLVSIISSAALVWMRLSGHSLPGCGTGSPCSRLGESAYSRVPLPDALGGEFPTSMLGLAFFVALLLGWLRGGGGTAFTWLVRLGAIASVVFVIGAVREQLLCQYCLVAHFGNLVFWGLVEIYGRKPRTSGTPLIASLSAFLAGCVLLGVLDQQTRQQAVADQETQLEESIATIVQPQPPAATQPTAAPSEPAEALPPPITGRWRMGPEVAPIRIVMFIGYQCQDCRLLDAQALRIAEQRDDVSLSIRHFPMHPDCNEALTRAMHGNACWAARAAETAGWIGGDDGFFRMHKALFARRGKFESTDDLRAAIREAQLDEAAFMQAFQDRALREEFDALIRDDAAEAVALGLHFTPMIFVNGVELKGWAAPNALARAVETLAATNPPAAGPQNDRPPRALGRYIADWAESVRVEVGSSDHAPTIGPADAPIQVTIWGDYLEPSTAEADRIVRAMAGQRDDIRYTWRHCPLDKVCNPQAPVQRYESCGLHTQLALLAAGDPDAFWIEHALTLAGQRTVEALRDINQSAGRSGDATDVLTADTTAWTALQATAKKANRLHRMGLPTIVLNGRIIPRWKIGGEAVLAEIIAAAGRE